MRSILKLHKPCSHICHVTSLAHVILIWMFIQNNLNMDVYSEQTLLDIVIYPRAEWYRNCA